jgi:hypothetical protein
VGRYALHIHHLTGPRITPPNGYQFTLIGNAIDGGSVPHDGKWGMTIHNSHYGLIQDNVAYNYGGAHFMFEDGSESYNVVEHNFAMRSKGIGDRLAEGTEGVGFWFRGPNNYIRGNVAANLWGNTTEAAYGFKFFMRYLDNINVPNYKGADTSVAGEYTPKNGNRLPILEFRDNEVYGAAQGMTYWWVNSQDPTPYATAQETIIKNLHIWHVFNVGVYHYPAARMTFDGLVIRGKDPAASACCGRAWFASDYAAKDIVIRNADIQGMQKGIITPEFQYGTGTIENSYFRTSDAAIVVPISGSINNSSPTGLPARTVIVRNARFDPLPGTTLHSISTSGGGGAAGNSYASPHEIKVYKYRGNPNDNFQVYWTDTRITPRPPATCVSVSHPEVGGIPCTIQGEEGGDTLAPAASTDLQVMQ